MRAPAGDSQAAALMAVLELEEREPDVFVGQTPRTALQRIFGGQVAGQALMAAGRTVPPERPVHSLHSYFLRPGDPTEEIRYAVERIRDGRSFSTRRVVAHQTRKGEDVAIFALTADYHQAEKAPGPHALPMPEVATPDELPSLADGPVATAHRPTGRWRSAGRWSSGCSRTRSSPGTSNRRTPRRGSGCGWPAGSRTTAPCTPRH